MNHTRLINHLIETELHTYGITPNIAHQTKNTMTEHKKITVAVLFGGPSNEREISLESGRNIVYKLSPKRYTPLPVFVTRTNELYVLDDVQLVYHATQEIEESLQPAQKIAWSDLPDSADFAFIALHGGIGENGSVQGTLELLGMPYNGSGVLASSLCMHKYKTNAYLRNLGFAAPTSWLIKRTSWLAHKLLPAIPDTIFPVILKPVDDGCSVGVTSIASHAALQNHLDEFFMQYATDALIEEHIRGMELTVGVIGNDQPQALPPSMVVAQGSILSIEEKFLPGQGENQTPAPLPAATLDYIRTTIERVYSALNLKGYARIDCFYQDAATSPTGEERVIILEVNTLPGMTPATCIFHQAAELGIKPMEFVDKIVQLGLEEHRKIQIEQPVIQTNEL